MSQQPWALVRVSIEQMLTGDSTRVRPEIWVGEVPIRPGENIGEQVRKFLDNWAQREFQYIVEESWAER